MMNNKLWLCLVFLVLLTACAGNTARTSKYPLMVGAARGKLFFAQWVIYAVDEHGTLLNLDLPKGEELSSDAEWSPDGQWIANSHLNPNPKSASDYDIYIMAANDNRKTVRLTYNLIFPLASAWSPDSTQLAIVAYAPDVESHYGIYLLNVACVLQGENCTPKPTFLIPGRSPDWSPDGKKIVYRDSPSDEIRVVNVQNPDQIADISQGLTDCGSPQWSPDGKQIAFACEDAIYLVDPDGGNRVSLMSGNISDLKWTPDGKKIAFIGTKTLDPNLGQTLDLEGTVLSTAVFMMDANGANLTRITQSNEESIGWFTWIPTNKVK